MDNNEADQNGSGVRGVVSDAEADDQQDQVVQAPQQQQQPQHREADTVAGEEAQSVVAASESSSNNSSEQQPLSLQQQQPPQQQQQPQQQIAPLFPAANAAVWPPQAQVQAQRQAQQLQPPPQAQPPSQHAMAMAHYYEARMRDHAAAYASAAAGAAWAAAQIAAQAAEFAYAASQSQSQSDGAGPGGPGSIAGPGMPAALPLPLPPSLPLPLPPPGHAAAGLNHNAGMYHPPVGGGDPSQAHGGYPGGGPGPGGPMMPMGPDPAAQYGPNNANMNMNYPMGQQQQQQQQQHFQPMDGDEDLSWQHNNNSPGGDQYQHQYQHQYHHHHQQDPYYDNPPRNNRRKRSQRRPPAGGIISIPRQHQNPNHSHNNNGNHNNNMDGGGNHSNNNNTNNNTNNNGSRVRRRLRDGGDSSNSSCCSLGTSVTSYNSDQAMSGNNSSSQNNNNNNNNNGSRGYNNNRRSSNTNNNNNSGGRGGNGNHYHRYKKKQRQPPDDKSYRSLLGKTGIAALYEFCNKRRMTEPSFALLEPAAAAGDNTANNGNESGQASKEMPAAGDFEMVVYLGEGGVEWGRGRGRTKGSAKHEAARKALQLLVPGVVFEPDSGIVVELPPTIPYATAANTASSESASASAENYNHQQGPNAEAVASLEDLAPHLASRLAIASGENNENFVEPAGSHQNNVDYSSKTLKRAWNIYPGNASTTTSEEDDDNAYYASRGASVCSSLLHAMVQIDDRIIEAPEYAFEVSKVSTTNSQMKRKGLASSGGSAIVIHRGSFTCIATLKVKPRPDVDAQASTLQVVSPMANRSQESVAIDAKHQPGADGALLGQIPNQRKGQLKDDGDRPIENPETVAANAEASEEPDDQVTILEAVGMGTSKRESKHIASARLLAMLFPDCENMVDVKAAAEAAREQYAASKALNKHTSRGSMNSNNRRRLGRQGEQSKVPRLSSSEISQLHEFCTASVNDPPLPYQLECEMRSILGMWQPSNMSAICNQVANFQKLNLNQDGTEERGNASAALSSEGDASELLSHSAAQDSTGRQLSRQKQLEEQVDKALQSLNERDDEGRTLPDELTADDVGRTVLRRADPEDVERIRRLLPIDGSNVFHRNTGRQPLGPVSLLGAVAAEDAINAPPLPNDDASLALRLWGSSSFVLLLCRAISAFEDPPLGCAVLTLGFSMEKGRVIRISQIGSELHLPRERFLECLEAFAASMNCALERNEPGQVGTRKIDGVHLTTRDLRVVLESHISVAQDRSICMVRASERSHIAASAPLQSVLEESEGGDDSDRSAEAVNKPKGRDKPSKRTRVE